MNKIALVLLLTFPVYSFAQSPIIHNAENFKIGTVLIFQECETENVNPGDNGENITWDFSDLKIKEGEKITEKMVLPKDTKNSNLFPKANLVEKYSDGRFVYMSKTETENHLLGFVGSKSNMIMEYENPMLFVKRPMQYGDSISDDYSTKYTVRNMDFKGKGKVFIVADGYGKLILPNKTVDDVLRVKIVQNQTDKSTQYQSETKMKIITYVWFSKENTSALLKISETKSQYFNRKTVEYLLDEKH